MQDLIFNSAHKASELRTAALLGRANAGPALIDHLRELQLASSPQKRRIAASAFSRDLSSTTATAGAYLIGTEMRPVEALLSRYSILAEGGLNVVTGLEGPLTIPRVTSVPTGTWLSADGTSTTNVTPTFGQMAMTPHFVSVYLRASRQLLVQSDAEKVISVQAEESIARAVDAAIFAGTGVSGQPTGIVNMPGIGTVSGSSLAASGLRSMRQAVLDAGAREDRIMWIANPATQTLLGGREFSAGSGRPLWDDGKILGRPAVATSLAPAGTLLCGDFSRVTVAVFDAAGAELEFDPYSSFQSGITAFRLILPVDIGVSPPAAFCVASSIT